MRKPFAVRLCSIKREREEDINPAVEPPKYYECPVAHHSCGMGHEDMAVPPLKVRDFSFTALNDAG